MFTTLTQYLTLIFPVVTVFCLLLFFRYYLKVSQPLKGTTEWIERIVSRPKFTLLLRRHPMERSDILPILIITLVYAAVAFFKLGNMSAPQSFFRFTNDKNSVVVTLTEPTDIGGVMYNTGLWVG
ncbi:MAG: dolichyl-phosphate-mannose--protein mannosyltransferase, partial [Clostridiales bacterium]|nr:dolichyl-phosphate-mannose--protein mannosyltransferase [Clostridiales bacterium]